jgi:hypothetical protein
MRWESKKMSLNLKVNFFTYLNNIECKKIWVTVSNIFKQFLEDDWMNMNWIKRIYMIMVLLIAARQVFDDLP